MDKRWQFHLPAPLSSAVIFRLLPAVLLFAAASISPAPAQSNLDPADLYLQGYLLLRDGAEFEESRKYTSAYQKYLTAAEIFQSISRSYPSWNPHMVSYRLRTIRESASNVHAKALREQGVNLSPQQPPQTPQSSYQPAPPAPAPAPSPAPAPPASRHPLPLPTQQPPAPSWQSPGNAPNVVAKIPERTSSVSAPVRPSDYAINAATNHIENKFRELRLRIDELGSERDGLANELRLREAQLQNTQHHLQQAKQRETELQQELAGTQQQLMEASANIASSDASGGTATLSPADAEKLSILEAQLTVAKSNLEAAGRKTAQLTEELSESHAEVSLLKEERGALITERNHIAGTLEQINTGDSVDLQRLIAANQSLRRQLEVAQLSAQNIAKREVQDSTEVKQLRQQVAGISRELETVRTENVSYRKQISDLTGRLQVVSAEIADTSGAGVDPQTRQENEMLRDIILRQLRQQARRQQAKELVLQELAKLEVNSNSLLQQLGELSGAEVQLTNSELALLQDQPQADSELYGAIVSSTPAGTGARDSAAAAAAAQPLSEEARRQIAAKLKDASAAFNAGNYQEAEKHYDEIVLIDRQNPYYLCNLGIIKSRLNKTKEAEVLFNKALAYDPFHAQSHLMLGTLHFENKNYDVALESFNQAAELNPNSARAHQYLGLIASHKGWQDRAEEEFKRAIEIDPSFAEAHFNLSVIYMTSDSPSKDLAAKHYQEAVNHGAKPDPAMEKFIRG